MKTPRIDGRSIEQFIPAHLRKMFYKNALPQYKYAIHDGYDPYGFSTDGLVLYLPLWALKGNSIQSVDAYKHLGTVTGALWRPNGREFDGSDDWSSIAAHASLNFLNAFAIAVWINLDTWVTGDYILNKNEKINLFFVSTPPDQFRFDCLTSSGAVNVRGMSSTGSWILIVISYDKDAGSNQQKIYVDDVVTNGTQTGTVDDTASNDLIIGAQNVTPTDNNTDGKIGEVWVWNRAISAAERTHLDNTTRWRYQ